ncbi:MAG: hypothetical protein VX278_23425 [Myxococcota bacterium]|nr:hypothetical protein [Myxococcota bacterium]
MARSMIPASLLMCTTTACTKSDKQIVEDICEKYSCLDSTDEEYLAEYISDCQTDGEDYFEDLDSCVDETRRYYICLSNLSCSEFRKYYEEGNNSVCKEEYEAYYDC